MSKWVNNNETRSVAAYSARLADAMLGRGSPNVFCFFGWHRWIYWPEETRHCDECGKEQVRSGAAV